MRSESRCALGTAYQLGVRTDNDRAYATASRAVSLGLSSEFDSAQCLATRPSGPCGLLAGRDAASGLQLRAGGQPTALFQIGAKAFMRRSYVCSARDLALSDQPQASL